MGRPYSSEANSGSAAKPSLPAASCYHGGQHRTGEGHRQWNLWWGTSAATAGISIQNAASHYHGGQHRTGEGHRRWNLWWGTIAAGIGRSAASPRSPATSSHATAGSELSDTCGRYNIGHDHFHMFAQCNGCRRNDFVKPTHFEPAHENK